MRIRAGKLRIAPEHAPKTSAIAEARVRVGARRAAWILGRGTAGSRERSDSHGRDPDRVHLLLHLLDREGLGRLALSLGEGVRARRLRGGGEGALERQRP